MKSFIVAISGASASIYGIRLIRELISSGIMVHLCISDPAFSIIKTETGKDMSGITVKETQEKLRQYFNSGKRHY